MKRRSLSTSRQAGLKVQLHEGGEMQKLLWDTSAIAVDSDHFVSAVCKDQCILTPVTLKQGVL